MSRNPKIGSPEAMRLEPPLDPPEDDEDREATLERGILRRQIEQYIEDQHLNP